MPKWLINLLDWHFYRIRTIDRLIVLYLNTQTEPVTGLIISESLGTGLGPLYSSLRRLAELKYIQSDLNTTTSLEGRRWYYTLTQQGEAFADKIINNNKS
jgi:DNA-binding PadR family transcriptional regulator